MNPDLSVHLFNDTVHVNITPLVSGLSYRSTIPGGFASADITLRKPLSVHRPEVAAYTNAVVVDAASGEIAWQGELEDPGPESRADGQVWQLVAMGPSARAGDITGPKHYVDSDPASFYRRLKWVAAATGETGSTPDAAGSPPASTSEEAVVITVPGGTVLGAGVVAGMWYDRLVESGQQLGGVGYTRLAGKADINYQNELAVYAEDGSPAGVTTVVSANWTTSSVAAGPFVVGTDWTAGMDIARLGVRRSGGATTVADDVSWGAFFDLYVAARRLLADGSFAPNADHNRAYVLASEVFADLVGSGWLPFDGATADITASSYHIDQLTYQDGANAQQILDDVLALQTDMFWAAWEGSPARCEFSAWPTSSAYIVGVEDGYEAPQSSADLFSEIAVRYVRRGRVQTLLVVATSGLLVDLGITRRAFVDLTTDAGSVGNAQQFADNFLADHAYPPNGGTLTIAHPVKNRVTGRLVPPSRFRPGVQLTIDGVDAYPDVLNATGRDGRAVVRVIATDYDAASNSVSCELDSYSRALARSLRRARRRRPNG